MREKKMIPLLSIAAWAILLGSLADASPTKPESQRENSHSRIAFVQSSAETPYGDIFTMNPDGTDIEQVTSLGPNNQAIMDRWSTDGKQLVFIAFPNFGLPQIWAVNADGSNPHTVLAETDSYDLEPAFSPDGNWVVFQSYRFSSGADGFALYRVRVDGSDLTAITNPQLEVSDYSPVYSPDGGTIAFQSYNRKGVLGGVYLTDPNGSYIRRITPPVLGGVDPSWSADGESIVFRTHCCNPQTANIWVVDRDGKNRERVTGSASSELQAPSPYSNNNPSYSPDDKSVVFYRNLPNGAPVGIFVVSADPEHPGTPVEINQGGAWPRWSPELCSHDATELRTRK